MYLKSVLICIAGVFIGILIFQLKEYIAKKRAEMKKVKTKKKKRKIEFSKIVLILVLSTYFLGIYIGVIAVLKDTMQLSSYLIYIGTPTTITIGFYSWKAKAENIIKIKQAYPEETEGTTVDFNNIMP